MLAIIHHHDTLSQASLLHLTQGCYDPATALYAMSRVSAGPYVRLLYGFIGDSHSDIVQKHLPQSGESFANQYNM